MFAVVAGVSSFATRMKFAMKWPSVIRVSILVRTPPTSVTGTSKLTMVHWCHPKKSADAMTNEVRLHRGDFMNPATRSRVMARIRGRDTGPELTIAKLLRAGGLVFGNHVDLPGRPDFVVRHEQVAVFCDGDFWHGWRFPAWRLKLSEKWESKIETNRRRDCAIIVGCRTSG